MVTTITTTTGKRLTTKIHINIIFNSKLCVCMWCSPFFPASVHIKSYSSVRFLFSILHVVAFVFYWHFNLPYGQRFIIIWFSSHFVSNLWFSRQFFVCIYACALFQFQFYLFRAFVNLNELMRWYSESGTLCWKIAFRHLLSWCYLIELIISARDTCYSFRTLVLAFALFNSFSISFSLILCQNSPESTRSVIYTLAKNSVFLIVVVYRILLYLF